MVPCVALLSLLGAAALAGVHSALVEKDGHTEEMITRCIVEVLLNSLSKANTPLINPQCKELLKKSNQPKQEEDNGGKGSEADRRPFSVTERQKQPGGPVREEQDVSEEEFKREAERGPKWHLEEDENHGGRSNQQMTSQETISALDGAETGKKNEHEEGRKEGDKRNHHSEEGGKEKKTSEEVEQEHLDKKSLLTSGKGADDYNKYSRGQKYVEEIIQNQETETQESTEEGEEEEEEEEEEESNEKYHHSFHEDVEDSLEREDVEREKGGHKTGLYQKKPRLGKYKNRHNGEKRDSPESWSEEESEFWDKRSHHPNHYYERGHHFVEPKNSFERPRSEEMERENRGKGHWDRYYPSQDERDEEDMKYHSRENGEKQYWYVRKRLLGEPTKEVRYHYEVRAPYSKAREENGSKRQSYENLDERRHHDQTNVQLEEMPKSQNKEQVDDEPRLSSQEGAREGQHYPGTGEGDLKASHYSERGKHFENKRTLLVEEGYPISHYLVENVKRALSPFMPYHQQLRWKNRHLEKNVDTIDPFLESEERKTHLSEREFVPEYNDYDLWEKQQLLEDLNHKQGNSNSPERIRKPDVKRQYDRMDELAHLLSYRKKSAEFPELYSSREDVKRGHIVGTGKFSQRPLTQEEEKELENLPAMDLELQKIAGQFNSI